MQAPNTLFEEFPDFKPDLTKHQNTKNLLNLKTLSSKKGKISNNTESFCSSNFSISNYESSKKEVTDEPDNNENCEKKNELKKYDGYDSDSDVKKIKIDVKDNGDSSDLSDLSD